MSDPVIKKIEEVFKAPDRVADKIKNTAEKDKNSYIIYECRSVFGDSSLSWSKMPVAKISYIKNKDIWKLYWKRASGRWELYGEAPEHKSLDSALYIIYEDKFGAFWG